jgi:hypothetical protein
MMQASLVSQPTEEQLLAFGSLLARSGKVIESQISGTSMGITLPPGSRIRIQPLSVEEYQVGQTVAFVRGSMIFAHRIAYRTSQCVLTRGDNHAWSDLPMRAGAILGLVTECLINGQWQRFEDVPHGLPVQPWTKRVLETAVRTCMLIDIRLALQTSRALMDLVRLSHYLRMKFLRHL